jgi:hypothetical protein
VWKIYTLSTAYDISTASYDGSSYDRSNTAALQHPDEVKWSSDGSRVYMLDTSDKIIYESKCSTAYDISTASHWSFGGFGSTPVGFDFNPTLTKVAILENSNRIKEFIISGGNINSPTQNVSYTGSNGTLISEPTTATSFCWNGDGKKFFVSCSTNNRIYQYSVRDDAPYEVRNVSYDNVSFDISSKEGSPTMISFENAGSGNAGGKLFVLGTASDKLHEFAAFGGAWSQQQKITPTETIGTSTGEISRFGQSISLSSDGNIFAVGTDRFNSNGGPETGQTQVWERSGTSWSEKKKIQSADIAANDAFGISNAISGDGKTLLVGAFKDDDNASNAGSAFVFTA